MMTEQTKTEKAFDGGYIVTFVRDGLEIQVWEHKNGCMTYNNLPGKVTEADYRTAYFALHGESPGFR